jgi:ribosomal protein S18 acetylase RimI-like enzyme
MAPEPARAEELAPAFRLAFRHLDHVEQEARVANALHLVQRGEIDARGVFVIRGPLGLLGAVICMTVPGASALVWPPTVAPGPGQADTEDRLARHGCAWLRAQGARLAQALLSPDEEFLAAPLLRNGFDRVTNLWYLRHDLQIPTHELATPVRLAFEPYDRDDPAAFHATLSRTYEQTLDCPEVNGVRDIEEVIRGHQAQGLYDPDRWWLARAGGAPVGVLLTTEVPESGDWEIAYTGVVPEARRRGFGREILLKGLTEARAAGAPRVTLSVDARNQPAWQLYHALGFEPFDRRAVFLAVWRGPAGPG